MSGPDGRAARAPVPRSPHGLVAGLLTGLILLVPGRAGLVAAGGCWWPPVSAPIVDPFRAPACAWCPGNRGVEYAPTPGASVTAVDSGVVTFSGVVAGTRYVVVRLPDGRRVTYGGLAATHLAEGDRVPARTSIGTVERALHLGLRVGDDYHDPEPWIGTVVPRARLVPLDGSAGRPAPPPRLRCEASRRNAPSRSEQSAG